MKRYYRSGFLLTLVLVSTLALPGGLYAMGGKPKVVNIKLIVDFGPADKPAFEQEIPIEKGMTPVQAVAQAYPIMLGFACCSLREIIEIGGVRIDPARNHWWTIQVNGSRKVSPQKKKLKEGDIVEWRYLAEDQ